MKERQCGGFSLSILVIIASVGLSSAASAAESDDRIVGKATGGGWIPGQQTHYTPQERADARAKTRLWTAYADLVDGRISQVEFDRIERRARRVLPSDRAARADPNARARRCPPQDPTCPRPRHKLRVPHRGQINGFFCGPASGTMIAAYVGKKHSAETGARLNQKHMGSRKHMKTWQNEVTHYKNKLWTRGLNRWLTGHRRGPYTQKNNPKARVFRGALLYNIERTKPFGVSTVERSYGAKTYNGHRFNGRTYIGHWIVARGYSRSGRRSFFVDSSTTVWETAHKRFRFNTKRFVKRYVDNGISA